jgi:hypothetical protein
MEGEEKRFLLVPETLKLDTLMPKKVPPNYIYTSLSLSIYIYMLLLSIGPRRHARNTYMCGHSDGAGWERDTRRPT